MTTPPVPLDRPESALSGWHRPDTNSQPVVAGPDPASRDFPLRRGAFRCLKEEGWIAGSSPAMTPEIVGSVACR